MAKNRGRRRSGDSGEGGGASGSDAEVLSNDVMNGNYDYNREFYDKLFDNINELSDETLQKIVSDFDNTFTFVKRHELEGEEWVDNPSKDYYLDKSWLGNPFEAGSDVRVRDAATVPRTMSDTFDTLQNIRGISEAALRQRNSSVTLQANNITDEYHLSGGIDNYIVRENGQLMYFMETENGGIPTIINDYR